MRRAQYRIKAARRNFIIGLIGSFVIGVSGPDEKKPEPADIFRSDGTGTEATPCAPVPNWNRF